MARLWHPPLGAPGTAALFRQWGVGFWFRRIFALVASSFCILFLSIGIVFGGARPRGRVFR
jgi:hypothetical protein